MQTWFTSDLHFMHKRIVEITERSKATTQAEHDAWLIDLWNSQVQQNDTVYHLGDFCFSSKTEVVQNIVNRLNGNKVFIRGNHDDRKVFNQLKAICSHHDYLEIKINGTKTCLMHYPIEAWNQQARGAYMLHGHSHGNLLTQHQGKRLDVGLDSAYNYFQEHRFFTAEDIQAIMQTRAIYAADHHKQIKE